MRTDGQTDVMKLTVAFRSLESAPKFKYEIITSNLSEIQDVLLSGLKPRDLVGRYQRFMSTRVIHPTPSTPQQYAPASSQHESESPISTSLSPISPTQM